MNMKPRDCTTTAFSGDVGAGTCKTCREKKGMPNPKDARHLFKLFSILLRYPDEELVQSVPDLRAHPAFLACGAGGAGCQSLLRHLEGTPLIALQEEYVRTFDLQPSTSLNLTFHECGDGKVRGAALVELGQLYRSAGYEPSTRELPDFLPLVLEFVSVSPMETALQVLKRYRNLIAGLARRLHEKGSPYGELLEELLLFIREFTGAGD